MQVVVRDNNVDQALRALKKKMQREGIFREMKLRNYYEKPSEKRAREKAEAIRRATQGGPQPSSAIATKARPAEAFRIRVTHIIPLAQPEEGVNAFEVRADLIDPPATWMRPGMEGIARLDTGKRSIISIRTRRISDTLRLWFWR